PTPEEEPMPTVGAVSPYRGVPADDDEIRRQHVETPRASDLARLWRVNESTVYSHLRRLQLTQPRGAVRRQLPARVAPQPPDEAPSIGVCPQPGEPRFLGRLGVEDLALAIELARRTEISPLDALSWVRADAGLAAADVERTA
ncbi:hypothetical protein, partial [Methylorubrum zatmanii]